MNRRLVVKDIGILEEQRVDIKSCPDKGVIVKVCYAGVCHTDSHIFSHEGAVPKEVFPLVSGHEISGVIHSVGSIYAKEPNALKSGDRVLAFTWGGCLKCDVCKAGYNTLCAEKTNPNSEGFGIYCDGGFQEYLIVKNPWRLVKLDDNIDMAMACLIPCSGVTGYNAIELCKQAIERSIKIRGYANVVHNGAGAVSLWTTEIIKALYGDKIRLLVTDLVQEKLKDVKAKGADLTLQLSKEGTVPDITKAIKDKFGGKGIDAAIDFVQTQHTQQYLFGSLAQGGCQVFVGVFGDKFAPLSSMSLIIRQNDIRGCYAGTKEQVCKVLDLVAADKVKGPHITFIKFGEIEKTMNKMIDGSTYKGRFVVEINKMSSKN